MIDGLVSCRALAMKVKEVGREIDGEVCCYAEIG